MIGYYGFRGAGKTLNAIADLYEQFIRNDKIFIISNTPLYFPPHPKTGNKLRWQRWYDLDELTAFFYYAMKHGDAILEQQTVILIDEASVVLNARFWKNIDPALGAFMFQSRHINVEMVFTTQHPSMVDANLRKITESWYHVEKLKLFGLISTRFSTIKEQELTPEGTVIDEHGTRHRLNVKKFWKMYRTDGTDSIVGLGRTLASLGTHGDQEDFLNAIDLVYRPPKDSTVLLPPKDQLVDPIETDI